MGMIISNMPNCNNKHLFFPTRTTETMTDMITRQLNDVHSLCSWVVGVFTCGPSGWEALDSDLVTLAYYRHTLGGGDSRTLCCCKWKHPCILIFMWFSRSLCHLSVCRGFPEVQAGFLSRTQINIRARVIYLFCCDDLLLLTL